MRLWRNHGPRLLLAGGFVLLLVAGILAVTLRPSRTTIKTVTITVPARTTTQQTTTAATTTQPAPPPPTQVAMSWDNGGGIVWHPSDVDPSWMGKQMRGAGFGWVAVYLGENDSTTPPDTNWITRFRAASGLPVGGWSVLGVDPAKDASDAVQLIQQDGLAFYIADAELPYGYTFNSQHSTTRLARSRIFVSTFRRLEPDLPAAISSYCRPDEHDLDWGAWARAGFVFLPQAYVNDFGDAADPAACVSGAASFFPKSQVHPTVGSYAGLLGFVAPSRFAHLLSRAGTTGFSIYPAEAGMSAENWQAYGQAIATQHIADRVK